MLKRSAEKKAVKKVWAFLLSFAMVLSNASMVEAAEQGGQTAGSYEAGVNSPSDIVSGGDSHVVSGGDQNAGTTDADQNQQTSDEGSNTEAVPGGTADSSITEAGSSVNGTYVLNISDLPDTAASEGNVGNPLTGGTENYFSVLFSAKSKIEANSKSFDDGFTGSKRFNAQGKAASEGASVKFTTSNPATVKVYWVAGDVDRQMTLLDTAGAQVVKTAVASEKNGIYISEMELREAGTYYLGGDVNNNYIFRVIVTETGSGNVEKPERADWTGVAAPVITGITVKEAVIEVTVDMEVGYDGADKVMVAMEDEEGNIQGTAAATAYKGTHVLTLTPTASGIYSFTATASRADEQDKVSASVTADSSFILPLKAPSISSITGIGGGVMKMKWGAVTEADSYIVTVDGTDVSITVDTTEADIAGLTVGQLYTFRVIAVRNGEQSPAGSAQAVVAAGVQQEWSFSAFGQSVSLGVSANGYSGSANDGSVTVYSLGGKGKLVPAATDGLAFYYTAVPADKNFTLTAKVNVDQWTYSNAQEGFGLMAADSVGVNGDDSAFWNNSYMAVVSKVEYLWDSSKQEVSDAGEKITMKIGIGSQEKKGITPENLYEITGPDSVDAIAKYFKSSMKTLETSCAAQGAGTYNIIGNFTNSTGVAGTQTETLTEMVLTVRKNNTGYFVSYTDAQGNVTTNKYYDTEALSQLDKDNVYVGFFASRNARVTVTDIDLKVIEPEDDEPAEGRPVTQVTPSYQIVSAATANRADYELVYVGNADGKLSVTKEDGTVLTENRAVSANEKVALGAVLAKGSNSFQVTFTPDPDYRPDEYSVLASYDTKSFTHTVEYITYGKGGEAIYVAPDGTSQGNGTKEKPLDIYTAVKYVQAGQTIVLRGGIYSLRNTVKVERGIDGTAQNMICLTADPESSERPVFDFNGACAGMIFAGDYWYCKGFDITNSANGQKGLQISGSYSVFDDLRAYHNGNTGIQVSRYLSTDKYEDWPSHDLILNCTSYGNADIGYEDADGFAAKLTVGDGIVFDGCIAHHNADDGWDLFAKPETGPIGRVVIKNSVAYANGYLEDGTRAGNGNGFKLGGSSITGRHQLMNSVAFDNKSKGIDSNSCPDIEVYQCTTFNNGSLDDEGEKTGGNVALYTKDAANTDFLVKGVISYRTVLPEIGENLSGTGIQDADKIYSNSNYYWNTGSRTSVNKAGEVVSPDWFESMTFSAVTRHGDGTVNMNGFLELTEAVPEGVGAVMTGMASGDITVPGETDGTVDNGSSPAEDENGNGTSNGSDNSSKEQNNGGSHDGNHNNGGGEDQEKGEPPVTVKVNKNSRSQGGNNRGNTRNNGGHGDPGSRDDDQGGRENGNDSSQTAGNGTDNENVLPDSQKNGEGSVVIPEEETPLSDDIQKKTFPIIPVAAAACIVIGGFAAGAVLLSKKKEEE